MALEIFRLVGSVFVDTDAADKSLKKTDKTAEGFGTKLLNVGKSAGKFALGVVGAAGAAGAAIVALTESTRDYRTEQGKLQTAFETQNFTAEQARATYVALNGVLGDSGQAVEAANHLAQLCDNQQELSTWTDICTGVYATFGDSLPIEGLTEAANETAKTGALTGGLADALNWAGVSEEEFQKKLDACNDEQDRAALITTTMNGLYAEAADKYREVNGAVIDANTAQDRLNSSMAKVGGAMEPFVTKGKTLIADVLDRMTPMLEYLGENVLPRVSETVEVVTGAIGGLIEHVAGAFSDEMPQIFNGFCDFIEGIFTLNIGQAFQGVIDVISGVWSGLVDTFREPINTAIGYYNSFIEELNYSPIMDMGLSDYGFYSGMPTIPYLASGGVLERGQIGFLEGTGAEAVVPLEHNKRWISAVARDMDTALGGGNQTTAMLQQLIDLQERTLRILAAGQQIVLNDREVGRTVRQYA